MSMLDIGVSGLLASRAALSTVGHNVANVSTPGFSRQNVELSTISPQLKAGSYAGKGVAVENIRRVYDSFLTGQVRLGTSNVGANQAFYDLAINLDNLLADPATGLRPTIQQFFDALQTVADDPTSVPARQVLLSEAQTLTQRFHMLDQRLADLRQGQAERLGDVVAEVNSFVEGIADLNHRIQLEMGRGVGAPPNDLLDQRDELLRQLSERIDIDVLDQDDGTNSVFIGNGQALVIGTQANQLGIVADPYDPTRLGVGYDAGAGLVDISRLVSGGEIGGLLDFAEQMLDPAQNALGRVAIGLAATFNDQHQLGTDLNGALGQTFFSPVDASAPAVYPHSGNTGALPANAITATVTTVGDLTTSDYRLDGTAAGYTLTRLSDGTVTPLPAFGAGPTPPLPLPATVEVDGVTLSWSAGTINPGDSVLIQPTRFAARGFGVELNSPDQVAAAAPIRTSAALGNTGTAEISPGTVDAPAPPNANLLLPVDITFNNPPTTFNVTGFGAAPYTEGADISYNGWTLQITGSPAAGDVFQIRPNTGGVGDNRNALLLSGLQTTRGMDNGKATYEDAYAQMVGEVGTQTRQSEINLNAHEVVLEQSVAARDSVSGVNLDEEAANLLRFQQAYQANAQVIGTANLVFQSLLDAVGG